MLVAIPDFRTDQSSHIGYGCGGDAMTGKGCSFALIQLFQRQKKLVKYDSLRVCYREVAERSATILPNFKSVSAWMSSRRHLEGISNAYRRQTEGRIPDPRAHTYPLGIFLTALPLIATADCSSCSDFPLLVFDRAAAPALQVGALTSSG